MENNERLLIGSYIRVWEELFEPYFHLDSIKPRFQDIDLLNEEILHSLSPFESVFIRSVPILRDINSLRGPDIDFLKLESLNITSSNLAALFWQHIARKYNLFHRMLSVRNKEGALVLVGPKGINYEEL